MANDFPSSTDHSAAAAQTAGKHAAMAGDSATVNTRAFWALTLGCVGVVFGDIGTSPLYAFREAIHAAAAGQPIDRDTVLSVLSMILWSLIIVVSLKYVLLMLRADNNGEGGTLSLMALAQRALGGHSNTVLVLGVIAAALFYGDAMITPAISVLSAVEGLHVAAPALADYVVPITVVILVALFTLQRRGTAKVAAWFGPITMFWFMAMAALGLLHIVDDPSVFLAFNPLYAVSFLFTHPFIGFIVLGAVFLAVTGGEALYADLGHFGRKPIQTAWFTVILPALTLNYLGQGALVLTDPSAIENPFYKLVPSWALMPMIVLATAATVIASQAVITGAFSLTSQAVRMNLLPRLEIRHTSASHFGQIFVPRINRMLLVGVLLLVAFFGSSKDMASAYGIAVSGTMLVDSIMVFLVIWKVWEWRLPAVIALVLPFAFADVTFFLANCFKVGSGGWVPLMIAVMIVTVMLTWRRGVGILTRKTRRQETPIADLVGMLEKRPPHIVKGTAVFLTSDASSAPTALLHSLKHYKVLHERNIILTLITEDAPRVSSKDRITIEALGDSFTRVLVRYGFMETPDLPRVLAQGRYLGLPFEMATTSFFLSRRSVRRDARSGMPKWQDNIFITLARNADDASSYFQIPTDRVVEIGTQVTV